MKRLIAAAVCVALIFMIVPAGGTAAALPSPDAVLRIGLSFDSTALAAANLENHTGAGYRFGYYDNGFTELWRTEEKKITVLKNRNMYFTGSGYSDVATDRAVGAYHVDSGRSFDNAVDAGAYSESLRNLGLDAFVHYKDDLWGVRIGSFTSQQTAADAAAASGIEGATAVTGSEYCVTVVPTGGTKIIFQFDCKKTRHLYAQPSLGEVERPVTWHRGLRYAGGFEFKRVTGNNITVVNIVSLQDYAKGVITWEMSPSWPLEALKAQALCAKSYAMCGLKKHNASGFDLCNDIHCQVYGGTVNESENSNRAVDETHGLFVTYQGTLAETFFFSSDGGSTEDAKNVWGTEVPYLKAVSDPYEEYVNTGYKNWSYTYTNDDLTWILNEKGYRNSGIVNMFVDSFTPAGNVYRLTLIDKNGEVFNFNREQARIILNSKTLNLYTHSQRYTVNNGSAAGTLAIIGEYGDIISRDVSTVYVLGKCGVLQQLLPDSFLRSSSGVEQVIKPVANNDGVYVVSGSGYGHNVGMSQYGAKAMAELGMGFEEIIKFYFTGVEITDTREVLNEA